MKTTAQLFIFLMLALLGTSCQDTIPNRQTVLSNVSAPDSDVEEPTAATRPTGAVFFQKDFCGCKDGKVVTLGNCASYCANLGSTSGAERFTANFTVGTDISLNSSLVNVAGWCSNLLPGESTANPSCVLEAKDDDGNIINLPITATGQGFSISASLENLAYDKTYLATLVEITSGARSDSVQLRKFSADTPLTTLGPLKNVLVTQYACVVRDFATDDTTGDVYYDSAYRIHFYFTAKYPPAAIPAGNSYLICHDVNLHGLVDDVLFPRFEQTPSVFKFWDISDPRFYDNNQNGHDDVNDVILQKAKNFGATNIPATTKFFFPMSLQGGPALNTEAGSSSTSLPLGHYMAPWIDQTTFKSYCLNNTHYNSTNPLFKAMRDVLQVETEGLYIGEKAAENVLRADGTYTTGEKDYILLRETDLKRVWFYLKNGVRTVPTDSVVQNNAIYFYYPYNFDDPTTPHAGQKVFQVKSAAQLNTGSTSGATDSGSTSTTPAHDNKIGCIPKI